MSAVLALNPPHHFQDDSMGERDEERTSGMEDELSGKSPSELEQEAYNGGEESDDEVDIDLDSYIESTVRLLGLLVISRSFLDSTTPTATSKGGVVAGPPGLTHME